MLTTAEATAAIHAAIPDAPAASVDVRAATGQVLRQTVVAERDQPPFDRVTMDGIAIASGELAGGRTEFPVQAMQAAGDPALALQPGHCIEIMTGASLPKGADCVIPIERISLAGGVATLEPGYSAAAGQFIHPRGSDHVRGAALLQPGARIRPMDIAVLISCGLTAVEVSASPVIRVISTGNELVPAGEPIEAHQIRMSNGPALVAMLDEHGYCDSAHDHIADEPDRLRTRIQQHLDDARVLVLSGGVSMGKADYVPGILAELGVEMVLHKISQRPGKPMWFGVGPDGQAVFALPGNPVSALVCCRQYVIPALDAAAGLREGPPEFASLAEDFEFRPALTCFLPVKLVSGVGGQTLAIPVKTNTSGDFTALSGTHGYVELPLAGSHFPAGSGVRLRRW